MTSMTHNDPQQIPQGDEKSSIEVRALDLRNPDTKSTIAWETSGDLTVALKYASKGKGVHLPTWPEGGVVIVGLDAEDDSYATHEVMTQRTPSRPDVEVIERAITVLQQLRDGLVSASGVAA